MPPIMAVVFAVPAVTDREKGPSWQAISGLILGLVAVIAATLIFLVSVNMEMQQNRFHF